MVHALSSGMLSRYFEESGGLRQEHTFTLRKSGQFSSERLGCSHRQHAPQKERFVVQGGLLVDSPKLRQLEHGGADGLDGNAEFKLVDRLVDIRASLSQRLHQDQRRQVSEVAGGGDRTGIAGVEEG